MDHWFKIPPDTKTYIHGPDPESVGMISSSEQVETVSALQTKYRAVLVTPDYAIYKRQS